MAARKREYAIKPFVQIAFTAILIYLVLRKIEWKEVKQMFLNANVLLLCMAFIAYFLSQVLASWRLLSFLKNISLQISFEFNFKLYLIGMFYNIFLPSGVGGDGYKIFLLKKKFELPTKDIFLALLFDRLSGLWAVGVIIIALAICIPQIGIRHHILILFVVIATLAYYWAAKKFFHAYYQRFKLTHCKAIAVQAMQLLSVVLIMLAQHFQGKFSPYLLSFLISSLAAIIPISVGGLGTREYVMANASSIFHMDQNLAVYVTSTFWLISMLAALPAILFIYNTIRFRLLISKKKLQNH